MVRLVQLSLVLRPEVYAPGETAPIGRLYIVNRGLALYGGQVYSRGKYVDHSHAVCRACAQPLPGMAHASPHGGLAGQYAAFGVCDACAR